jgi:hypothetical protein
MRSNGDNMIRTQISLDEGAYRAAKEEAKRQGVSLAEVLRRSVAVTLNERRGSRHPWMRWAGALASGDRKSSRTVDEVVYGRPRP